MDIKDEDQWYPQWFDHSANHGKGWWQIIPHSETMEHTKRNAEITEYEFVHFNGWVRYPPKTRVVCGNQQ